MTHASRKARNPVLWFSGNKALSRSLGRDFDVPNPGRHGSVSTLYRIRTPIYVAYYISESPGPQTHRR